jgi:hypothetical protein
MRVQSNAFASDGAAPYDSPLAVAADNHEYEYDEIKVSARDTPSSDPYVSVIGSVHSASCLDTLCPVM